MMNNVDTERGTASVPGSSGLRNSGRESVQDSGRGYLPGSNDNDLPLRWGTSGDDSGSTEQASNSPEPSADKGAGSGRRSRRDPGMEDMGRAVPEQRNSGDELLYNDSAPGGARNNGESRRDGQNSRKLQSEDASPRVKQLWDAKVGEHYEWGVWSKLPVIRCTMQIQNPGNTWTHACGWALLVPDDGRRARQLQQAREHFWLIHNLKLTEG